MFWQLALGHGFQRQDCLAIYLSISIYLLLNQNLRFLVQRIFLLHVCKKSPCLYPSPIVAAPSITHACLASLTNMSELGHVLEFTEFSTRNSQFVVCSVHCALCTVHCTLQCTAVKCSAVCSTVFDALCSSVQWLHNAITASWRPLFLPWNWSISSLEILQPLSN